MISNVISVETLLSTQDIRIPQYQRPYKWTIKNVNQLLDDILFFKHKKAYRLGTLVIHKEDELLKIVDGQQRTITLFLIALAINNNRKISDQLKKNKSKLKLKEYVEGFEKWEFSSKITQYNIQNNYLEIERRIHEFSIEAIEFFFKKCELVQVVINDISEAFQFFDSQNARGKDLEPHDLLKAFHLREMAEISVFDKKKSVDVWEEMNSEDLSKLFDQYLFRIRNWSKIRSARVFRKNDIDVFKGISLKVEDISPSAKLHQIVHYYVDDYNEEYHRKIDKQQLTYPFQLDQIVINGKRFFEMIAYYKKVIDNLENIEKRVDNNNSIGEIFKLINTYDGKSRKGDRYVRNLFDCALIYYMDRFAFQDIDRIVDKLFIWAYSLRLKLHAVQMASMDNYALENQQVFKLIREATSPKEIINMNLEVLSENNSSKTQLIQEKFIELRYFNDNTR